MRNTRTAWLLVSAFFFTSCSSSIEQITQKLSNDPDSLYDAAIQALGAGDLRTAELRIRRAIELVPKNALDHQTLGLIKHLQGDEESSLAESDTALKLNPALTDARNTRGLAYLNLGRPVEAEADFRQTLADPNYPQKINVQFNLGIALLHQSRPNEALTELYQAQKANPSIKWLYSRLGEAHEALGNFEKASANFLLSLQRDGKNSSDAFRLATCLDRLNKRDLAAKYFRLVIETAPASTEAQEARERLGSKTGASSR